MLVTKMAAPNAVPRPILTKSAPCVRVIVQCIDDWILGTNVGQEARLLPALSAASNRSYRSLRSRVIDHSRNGTSISQGSTNRSINNWTRTKVKTMPHRERHKRIEYKPPLVRTYNNSASMSSRLTPN